MPDNIVTMKILEEDPDILFPLSDYITRHSSTLRVVDGAEIPFRSWCNRRYGISNLSDKDARKLLIAAFENRDKTFKLNHRSVKLLVTPKGMIGLREAGSQEEIATLV